jgi:3-deoxy-D-manno-octulosonate 8-phosphate phosphatase (KDO 8-P phosphatase)
MKNLEEIFTGLGGSFLTSPGEMTAKLKRVKAFIFDWDGVFNNGEKVENGSSVFSEVDSMGTNLLRFAYWLQNKNLPYTAVISGEKNSAAFWFCTREHFHSSYYKVAHKIEALDHFCKQYNLKHEEVAFVFDDVLDLSVAAKVGIRILIRRKASPLLTEHVIANKQADYATGSCSGNFAVREACELLMGLQNMYDKTVSARTAYDAVYDGYREARNKVNTLFFTKTDKGIVELNPKA